MEDEFGNFMRSKEQNLKRDKQANPKEKIKKQTKTQRKVSTAINEKCEGIKCWFVEKYDNFKIKGGKPSHLFIAVVLVCLIIVSVIAYSVYSIMSQEEKDAQLTLFFMDDANISQLNITIQKIDIKTDLGFKTVFEGSKIIALQKDNIQISGINISAGNYSGIKLWLDTTSKGILENKSIVPVDVQTKVFVVNFDKIELFTNQSMDLLLDFNLIKLVKQTAEGKIIFVPLDSIKAKQFDELADEENESMTANIVISQKTEIKQNNIKIEKGQPNVTQIKSAAINKTNKITGKTLGITTTTKKEGVCVVADIANSKLYIDNVFNTTIEKDKTTCVNLSEGNYSITVEKGRFGKLVTNVSIKNIYQKDNIPTKPEDAVQCDSCESCNKIIKESNKSQLYIEITKDITSADNCILLKRYNTTIDCNSHKIIGSKQGSAIFVRALQNINITNCEIENFNVGITLSGLREGLIANNKISKNNKQGIYMYLTSNVQVLGNEIFENAGGIFAEQAPIGGKGNIFKDNKIKSNSHYGLALTKELIQNKVINNTITYNGKAGLYIDDSGLNSIVANIICNNTHNDIFHISTKGPTNKRISDSSGMDNTCDKTYNWHDASKVKNECAKKC